MRSALRYKIRIANEPPNQPLRSTKSANRQTLSPFRPSASARHRDLHYFPSRARKYLTAWKSHNSCDKWERSGQLVMQTAPVESTQSTSPSAPPLQPRPHLGATGHRRTDASLRELPDYPSPSLQVNVALSLCEHDKISSLPTSPNKTSLSPPSRLSRYTLKRCIRPCRLINGVHHGVFQY